MKLIFMILSIGCGVWAGWSLIRFLFLPPSISGDYAGWEWIVSIFIELALSYFFYSLAKGTDE